MQADFFIIIILKRVAFKKQFAIAAEFVLTQIQQTAIHVNSEGQALLAILQHCNLTSTV